MDIINQEFVIKYFIEKGCKLLSEYRNQREQIQYLCKCGKISTTNFYNFKNSSPYCWDCAAAKQAYTQEFVESIFKQSGCELFDTYKNNRTRMKFKCKCGNISTITFASFFNKQCYCENCGGTKKLTTGGIKATLESVGYKLLSDYINAKIKITVQCNKGHIHQILWNNFKKGKRCKTCFQEEKWNKPEDRPFILKCRSLLRHCLKNIKLPKTDKTEILLGYNGIELRNHIIKHPNWDAVKDGEWHLDHFYPIKAFCDYAIKDIKLINCLENLRPIAGKENMSKGSKYNKEEFEVWLTYMKA